MSSKGRPRRGSGVGSSREGPRSTPTSLWIGVTEGMLAPSGPSSLGLFAHCDRFGWFMRRFLASSERLESIPRPICELTTTMEHGYCFRLAPSTAPGGRTAFSSSQREAPIPDFPETEPPDQTESKDPAGKPLSLAYLEWMNGFPKDWTRTRYVCKPLETRLFLNPRRSSSD